MTDQPQDLPEPLVPAEVDLRGLEYMPLLGGKLFGSDFDLDANDAEFRVGLRLWWAAWNQVPAASLPPEDHRQRGLAGLAENPAKWRKVRDKALQGFIPCNDGRLYHPIVAQQALIAWEKRAEHIEEKENAADRQRRSRAERKAMFADLRARDIRPKYDIPMDELRALHKQHVTPSVTPSVTVTTPPPVTEPVTVTATAKTGRDGTGQEIQDNPPATATTVGGGESDPPEANGHSPTQAGALCRDLRLAGISRTNPGHPRLLALLAVGATAEEFLAFVDKAIDEADDPFLYLLGAVEGERKRAKQRADAMHRGPMPKQADDRTSRQLQTAGLMTGGSRQSAQPAQETVDVPSRVIPS